MSAESGVVHRTFGGVRWEGVNVRGVLHIGAEVAEAKAQELELAVRLAQELGMTADVSADFVSDGNRYVEFRIQADQLHELDALVELLAAA